MGQVSKSFCHRIHGIHIERTNIHQHCIAFTRLFDKGLASAKGQKARGF